MDERNMMGVQLPPEKNAGLVKKILMVLIPTIVLVLIFGGVLLVRNAVQSDGTVVSEDLITETEKGISFKRPSQWKKVRASEDDVNVAFIEGGRSLNDSEQGMLLSSEDLGVNYNDLTVEEKAIISTTFEERFSDPAALENGSCEELSDVVTDEITHTEYDTAFTVEATCDKFSGRNIKAKLKMLIGIKDESFQIIVVLASNEAWEESGSALNEILDSAKPAS